MSAPTLLNLNDLEKAKKLMSLKFPLPNLTLKNLKEQTGVAYKTIKNYSNKPELLNKASWKTVSTLARVYESFIIKEMTFENEQELINQFNSIQKELKTKKDKQLLAAIKTVTLDNPVIMYYFYKEMNTK